MQTMLSARGDGNNKDKRFLGKAGKTCFLSTSQWLSYGSTAALPPVGLNSVGDRT
jgi:hypothetical protein